MKDISALLKTKIRTARNWPQPGVNFRDVSGVFADVEAFQALIEWHREIVAATGITRIAGIDARGFLIAGALAHACKLPLALVRKKGKPLLKRSRPRMLWNMAWRQSRCRWVLSKKAIICF